MKALIKGRAPRQGTDAVTNSAKVADAAVLIQYLALVIIIGTLAWVQRPLRDMRLFYPLLGGLFLYLCVRAYLTLVRRLPEQWGWLWPIADVVIVSVLVSVTGGIRSYALLLYLLPLGLSSIQHKPGRALVAGILSSVLYVAVTRYPEPVPHYWLMVGPRVGAIAIVTFLAVVNAVMEVARFEEVVAMREQLTLADYRQRLSQEMHDGIQQDLVGLTVRLELARQLMAEDPEQAARVAVDQRFIARQVADELRTLVYLLRSPIVEREGFVDALRRHLSLFAERSSISAPLSIEGANLPLPPEVAHAAFRVVQEALTNAEKHSRAKQVDVRLKFDPNAFECCVKDDGIGFDTAAVADRVSVGSGFGLRGMKQRADSMGGWLRVTSQPGEGTEIVFGVPLNSPDPKTQKIGSPSPPA